MRQRVVLAGPFGKRYPLWLAMRTLASLLAVTVAVVGCSYDWDRFSPSAADGSVDAPTVDGATDGLTDAADGASLVPDGLVMHFPFEEAGGGTTRDAVSGLDLAVLEGGPVFEPGVVGNALRFDGSDDRVEVNRVGILRLGDDFSVALFVRPDILTQDAILFSCTGDPHFLARFDSSDRNTLDWVTARVDYSDWPMYATEIDLADLRAGEWQHLAFTATDGDIRIYVDGIEVDSKAIPTPPTETRLDELCHISGAFWPHIDHQLAGAMDDLRLYDRALSPGEVSMLAEQRP